MPKLTIVVPVFNEAESLTRLNREMNIFLELNRSLNP